jgi:aryl-alcohol dehydrogenase-like predicted oxidoreductase
MNDLITQGKVLYWGVSEWTGEQINDAVALCDDHGWHRPAGSQPLYNMFERHREADFELCARLGVGIVNFSPLAEGVLTGKYNDGVPPGTRGGDKQAGEFIRPRLTDDNLAKARKLTELATGLDVSLAIIALAWCLRRHELTSCIIGASKPSQITENIAASGHKLDDEVLDRIGAVLGE